MKKRVWISLGILILVIGAVSFYNITGNVVVSDFSISSYSCENGFSGNMGGDGWVVLTSDGPAQQLGKRFYELNEGTFNIKTADLETEASLVGDDSWFWVGVWSKELGDWVGGLDSSNPDAKGIWFQDDISKCNDGVNINSQTKFGIMYSLWHCPFSDDQYAREYDISNMLKEGRPFGEANSWHWVDEPKLGYYCLTEEHKTLQRHAEMLRDAGIDFVFLDITNWPSYSDNYVESHGMIDRPLRNMLDVWKDVGDAPKITPWIPIVSDRSKDMIDRVLEYMTNPEYENLWFRYNNKKLIIATDNRWFPVSDSRIAEIEGPQYGNDFIVRKQWGQLGNSNQPKWSYLEDCQENFKSSQGTIDCNQRIAINNGIVEQVPVDAAYHRRGCMNSGDAVPKFQGRTFRKQFETVFENAGVPIVTIATWNEWLVQNTRGATCFLDNYDIEYGRDIEPAKNEMGYYYYNLLNSCIGLYKDSGSCDDAKYSSALCCRDIDISSDSGDKMGCNNNWLCESYEDEDSCAFDCVNKFSVDSYSCESGFSGNMKGDGWLILSSDGISQELGKRYYRLGDGAFNIKAEDLETEVSLVGDDSWFWVGIRSAGAGDWVSGLDPSNPDAKGIWFQDDISKCNEESAGGPVSECTINDWTSSLSPSICPSSEIQAKTWVKVRQCQGGVAPSTEEVSCVYNAPTCTYTYSDYGECQSTGNKFRTVTSSSPDNCQGEPDLDTPCVYIPPCTINDWDSSFSPTICPSSGIQTKAWTKTGQCQGGVAPSTEEVSCVYNAPTCTYTYSDYGECQSTGNKFRTVTSSSPDNCQGNPDLSQQCVYIPLCTGEDWNDICSPEDCPIDGIQNVSWEKKGVCKDGVDKADLVEEHLCDPSIPACESFNYSNWSECGQNFRRTRNIISSSPVGCQGGGAVLGEYCLYKYKVFETNNDTDEGDGLSLLDGEGVDESEGFAEVAGSNVESRDTEELEEVLDELNLSREELQILQPKLLVEKRLFVFDVENILDNKILVLGVLIFALMVIIVLVIYLMRDSR